MAKTEAPKTEAPKIKKQCPNCSATKFRQHAKGPIVGNKMKVESYDFQCLGCHTVFAGLDRLIDAKA